MTSAYIFLDVDGVLNPYAARLPRPWDYEDGIWFKPGLGEAIVALAARYDAQIVWLTAWEDRANKWVSPLNNLPSDLKVVRIPWEDGTRTWRSFGYLKALGLKRWLRRNKATGVPFIWFDDEPDAQSSLDTLLPGKGQAIQINEKRGITAANLAKADRALAAQVAGKAA